MGGSERIFGLPRMSETDFNRLMKARFADKAPQWIDADKDGRPEPEEVSAGTPEILSTYVTASGTKTFTPLFEQNYRVVAELFRQERIKRELELTYLEPVTTDIAQKLREYVITDPEDIQHYKDGIAQLTKAAEVMQRLYQRQVGFSGNTSGETLTADDKELIARYGHPWCIGDQTEFCVALPSLPERGSGVFASGVTCEQAGSDLMSFANPFSTVGVNNGQLVSTPYAEAFKEGQTEAAGLFRSAAEHFVMVEREWGLASHLRQLAIALESNKPFPYLESDKAWHTQGESKSIILIRTGADEVGGDGVGDSCTTKARFHLRLGFVDTNALRIVEQLKPLFQGWENRFEQLVKNPSLYKAQEVVLNLPQFSNIIYESGDATGGPNGTAVGQTLPNWCGENGMEEPCKRRVMVFVNKTLRAYNTELVRRYIMPLFAPAHASDFTAEGSGLESVLFHEIAHNFGPQQGKKKPGSEATFDATLGKWKMTIEELKAQTCAMFFAGEMLKQARAGHKAGKIDKAALEEAEKHYRQRITYDLAWAMRMILRATRGGKFEGGSYSKLAAIQAGALTQSGALVFDTKSRQWSLHFENDIMLNAVERLMQRTLQLYAKGDFAEVDGFAKFYIEGEGFASLHSDRIVEVAGNMPSVLFKYEIK